MQKTMSELLANSFPFHARVSYEGKIVLIQRVFDVMGRRLKGQYCLGNKYGFILVSTIDDEYFDGEPLAIKGTYLLLTKDMAYKMSITNGETLYGFYNGAGNYFTINKIP